MVGTVFGIHKLILIDIRTVMLCGVIATSREEMILDDCARTLSQEVETAGRPNLGK